MVRGEGREPRGEQAFGKFVDGRDVYPLAIQKSTRAALGGEQLVSDGVEDDAGDDFTAVSKT